MVNEFDAWVAFPPALSSERAPPRRAAGLICLCDPSFLCGANTDILVPVKVGKRVFIVAIGEKIKKSAGGAASRVRSIKAPRVRKPDWKMPRMPRFPRWLRVTFAWLVLLLAVLFFVGAGLELAASGRISSGVSIDGTSVGGMSKTKARSVVEQKIKPLEGNVQATFEGKPYTIDIKAIKFTVDLDGMVQEAYLVGKRSPALVRVTRRLLGIQTRADIPVMYSCDKAKLTALVGGIAKTINRQSSSASISMSSGSPVMVHARQGVRVKVPATVDAIIKALPTANRAVPVIADMTQPEILDSDVSKIVVIRQKEFRLHLYDREKEVNSFKVAVGMPQYPTPNGRFHITYKERNPTWLPTSEWAKDKQGIPQPPGPNNPLGGYWMDIGGGIGIHATPFPNSLGSQASHGCIRMADADAAELFTAVKVGTPVFITE